MQDVKPVPRRWPANQSFGLSADGRLAAAAYRARVAEARGHRAGFDSACSEWARTFALEPGDGACLTEVGTAPATLRQLEAALAVCGQSRAELTARVDRLVVGGVLVPVVRSGGRRR